MYTRTNTCTHALTHVRTSLETHKCVHAVYKLTHYTFHVYTPIHTHTHTRTQTHTHTHTHAHQLYCYFKFSYIHTLPQKKMTELRDSVHRKGDYSAYKSFQVSVSLCVCVSESVCESERVCVRERVCMCVCRRTRFGASVVQTDAGMNDVPS